jgi:excisionase family DNA binding protein
MIIQAGTGEHLLDLTKNKEETMPGTTKPLTVDAVTVPLRLLLRPEEAAHAIGVSRARFYQLLATGEVKSIKVGRSRRVPVAELTRWVSDEVERQTA